MKNEITAKRLIQALDRLNMKAQELADKSGLNKASISQYVNGTHAPSNISAGKMAQVLGVSPVWLMGYDVPMLENELTKFTNLLPIGTDTLPVLGRIACGEPIYMNEEREFYTQKGTKIKADFIFIAQGDSMTGARIHDGDIVFIRKQSTVDNGEIAAVAIGDEATLKRFYYYKEQAMIILRACNPDFEDLIYTDEKLSEVSVIGKAIAFQSDVR